MTIDRRRFLGGLGASLLAAPFARMLTGTAQAQGGPAGLGDRRVVALIAYMQRLGTDLYRTPEPDAESDPDSAGEGEGAPADASTAQEGGT